MRWCFAVAHKNEAVSGHHSQCGRARSIGCGCLGAVGVRWCVTVAPKNEAVSGHHSQCR